MNTTTLERTESAPRLQAFEQVDKANEDALWEQQEWKAGCINRMCAEIRKLGAQFGRDELFQALSTAEATLYEHGQPELASQVGDFACEVQ